MDIESMFALLASFGSIHLMHRGSPNDPDYSVVAMFEAKHMSGFTVSVKGNGKTIEDALAHVVTTMKGTGITAYKEIGCAQTESQS